MIQKERNERIMSSVRRLDVCYVISANLNQALTVDDDKWNWVSFNKFNEIIEGHEGNEITDDETRAEADHSLVIGKRRARFR